MGKKWEGGVAWDVKMRSIVRTNKTDWKGGAMDSEVGLGE